MKKFTITKILVVSASTLFGIAILATTIANKNVNAINTYMGTSSYEQIQKGESTADTEYYKSKYNDLDDVISDTDKIISEVVEEGAVLIKNENNALPLSDAANKKVSLFGVGSYRSTLTATGSVSATSATGREVDLKTGLENAGFDVNEDIWGFYASDDIQKTYSTVRNGMMVDGPLIQKINEVPWSIVPQDKIRQGDVAIYNIVRVSGEGNKDVNRYGTEDTSNGDALTLSIEEINTLKGLKALKDQNKISKIIVLLNCTATVELDFLNDSQYGIDAALQIQAVGTTGFNGVGKLLSGEVNPSGKSSDTLWYDNEQNPTLANQAGYSFLNPENLELHTATNGQGGYEQHYVVYQEGIYLGYRYTETRYEDYVTGNGNAGTYDYSKTVAVPFGYGESYTTFEYSNFKVNKENDGYVVTVDVTNTGSVAGKESVEVYLQKPYGEYNIKNGVEASSVELVGFDKTDSLKPGASETVTITIDDTLFASYDANNAKTYVLTEGDYYLSVGNGAHDAINNILAAKGYTPGNTSGKMDDEGQANLAKVALKQNKLDSTKYSKSAETDKTITNLFDDSDLNKYSETKDKSPVEYITRNDWSGTVVLDNAAHDTYTKVTLTSNMLKEFRAAYDESLIQKDDVAYPTYGKDSGLKLVDMRKDSDGNDIPYDSSIWNTFMDQLTWDDTVNLLSEGMRMTAALQNIGKIATLDHNGPLGVTEAYAKGENGLAKAHGESTDILPSTFPSAGNLAATMNLDLINRVGEIHGENCLWAGYNGMYGPGINIHRSQYSSRNTEYYSEDGFLTGRVSAVQVKGTQSKGIYVYIKHFALNDQETNRYGLSTWLNEQSFREIYLRAFEIAIKEGDAHAMMSSYNRIGTRNAAGKYNLMTEWLRGEIGFDGFVVTDMYQLQAYQSLTFYLGMLKIPAAVYCGNDLVDGSITSAKQFDAYKTGYGTLANRMRESAKRILYTTAHSTAVNGLDSNTEIVFVLTWWQITLITLDVVFGLAFAGALGWFGFEFYKKNLKKTK